MTSQHCAPAFALVEVMVSLFIATVTVLAMAMIAGHSQKEARAIAKEHSAWSLGVEMAEWLRTGAAQPQSHLSTTFFERVQRLAAAPDCYKLPCAATEAADFYAWHWYQRLLIDVSGARVVLCRDGQAWQLSVRAFRWSCPANLDESSLWVLKLGWSDDRGSDHGYPSIVIPVGSL